MYMKDFAANTGGHGNRGKFAIATCRRDHRICHIVQLEVYTKQHCESKSRALWHLTWLQYTCTITGTHKFRARIS